MNRLLSTTRRIKKNREKLFCAFLTLGFPNLEATEKLIEAFEKAGVDIIELGFPFSDPLADGPTIQYSSEMALKHGVRLEHAFDLVKKLRKKKINLPILLFTYLNPVYHFGLKRFAVEARRAGFDGVIIPDLPPEEEKDLAQACNKQGLAQVFLVAPTTEKKRAALIAKRSKGFIYYVSLRGVTGARKSLPSDIEAHVRSLKRTAKKPVLIGFGVSSPEQAWALSRISDGVIVGSAIVDRLRQTGGQIASAVEFVREMVKEVKQIH